MTQERIPRDRESIISWLKTHGLDVGKKSKEGSEKALNIVKAYTLWQRCPADGFAEAFTAIAIDEYLAEEAES